jgi:hypothetical protein
VTLESEVVCTNGSNVTGIAWLGFDILPKRID